jgi:glycerate kinase
MRIVVAPDKFKGSLTAVQAAAAIGEGLRRSCPDAEIVLLPVADGGDGTVDAAVTSGYERRTARVQGPTGQPVDADFALRGESAVLELAEASGLRRLPAGVRAPLTASTYGTGELVRAALEAGARRVVLGVGGSASTDGGAGMAAALGVRLAGRPGQGAGARRRGAAPPALRRRQRSGRRAVVQHGGAGQRRGQPAAGGAGSRCCLRAPEGGHLERGRAARGSADPLCGGPAG